MLSRSAVLRNFLKTYRCARSYTVGAQGLDKSTLNVAKLQEKGIVRVLGKDAPKFLQGLLTNNMNCFVEEHCQILSTAALNVQGRVLFDLFVYVNPSEDNHFLLECEENEVPALMEHLKTYKLRSKVEILDARKEIEAWFVFPPQADSDSNLDDIQSFADDLVALPDPRLNCFGTRVLTPWNRSPSESIPDQDFFNVEVGFYQNYRHRLGIAEGALEILSGKALPLEYNFGLLNGISFSKGCYIGQELTARSHHTGVIRKRVMPIQLKDVGSLKTYPVIENQIPVKSSNGKSAGSVITMVGGYGLGLLRLNEALSDNELMVMDKDGNSISVTCKRPEWWPDDLKF